MRLYYASRIHFDRTRDLEVRKKMLMAEPQDGADELSSIPEVECTTSRQASRDQLQELYDFAAMQSCNSK